jgi:hypothetical protein
MTKFIDLKRTVYGFDQDEEGFTQTGDILQAILSDDAQGHRHVHAVIELDVKIDLDKALAKIRRWAREHGYSEPVKKSAIDNRQGGAFPS